jgi:hypothetical protein
MLLYQEMVLLADGAWVEVSVEADRRYRLCLRKRDETLVEYCNDGVSHRRSLRGRAASYAFRSIEQLRYDFERDAEDAERQG